MRSHTVLISALIASNALAQSIVLEEYENECLKCLLNGSHFCMDTSSNPETNNVGKCYIDLSEDPSICSNTAITYFSGCPTSYFSSNPSECQEVITMVDDDV